MGWGINLYNLVRIPVKKVCNGYYLRWYYNGWHYWFFLPGTLTVVTEGEKYRTIGTRKIAMGSGQVTRGQILGLRTIMYTREVSLLTITGWMNIRIEPGTLSIYDNQLAGAEIEFIAIIGSKEISYGDGYTPVNIIPVVSYPYVTCEVIIGTQIWACKNFDSNYPASKVYNDDEANRAIYGGLYTYAQIMSSGFTPVGWHIPTLADWDILINYLGTIANVGGYLKEVGFTHWDAPNTGAVDSTGFTALGSGFYISSFLGLNQVANLWTADEISSTRAYLMQMSNISAGISAIDLPKNYFNAVRLIKDTPAPSGIFDIDGNEYHSVIIGSQEWLVENLKTTHYADGASISLITDNTDWINDITGAMCYYNNDIANKPVYGALYNWYAVNHASQLVIGQFTQGGIISIGWRVPSETDFNTLIAFAGGGTVAAKNLKEIGLTHWTTNEGTDSFGFKLLPGGSRYNSFNNIGDFGNLWTTDSYDINNYHYFYIAQDNSIAIGYWLKRLGYSVRCIRDIP